MQEEQKTERLNLELYSNSTDLYKPKFKIANNDSILKRIIRKIIEIIRERVKNEHN